MSDSIRSTTRFKPTTGRSDMDAISSRTRALVLVPKRELRCSLVSAQLRPARVLALLIGAIALCCCVKPSHASQLSDLFQREKSSVVFIYVTLPSGAASGSGFVLKSDASTTEIVTANHVIEDAQSIDVILDGTKSERYSATILKRDRIRDVAILQISAGHRTPLLVMDSSQVLEGNDVAVIGYPESTLIYQQLGDSLRPEIHKGIVDAIRLNGEIIQFDAVIEHGDSGGPVIDVTTGAVVGIVRGALLDQSYLEQGLEQALPGSGYAMSGTTIEDVLHSNDSDATAATVSAETSSAESGSKSTPAQLGEPASSSAYRVGYATLSFTDPLAQTVNSSLIGRLSSYFASDNSFYMVPVQVNAITDAYNTSANYFDSEQLYSYCQQDRLNAFMLPIVWWNLTGGLNYSLYGPYYSGNAQTWVSLYVTDCAGDSFFAETKSKSENRYFVNHPPDREITDMANDLIDKLETDFASYQASNSGAWQSLLKNGIGVDPSDGRYHGLYSLNQDKTGAWRITAVFPGGPGDKAGLKPGDIVLSIAGNSLPAKPPSDFEQTLANYFDEPSYDMSVERPGGVVDIEVHTAKFADLLSMISQ
jgi:S1-C subfamily serine protease